MKVILSDGTSHEGTKLEVKGDQFFLDNVMIGKCNDPAFQVNTIDGEVFMSQWKVLKGGANV